MQIYFTHVGKEKLTECLTLRCPHRRIVSSDKEGSVRAEEPNSSNKAPSTKRRRRRQKLIFEESKKRHIHTHTDKKIRETVLSPLKGRSMQLKRKERTKAKHHCLVRTAEREGGQDDSRRKFQKKRKRRRGEAGEEVSSSFSLA